MISDIDLKDFNRSETHVKLYDAPRNSVVTPVYDQSLLVDFSHIDGMYSFCKIIPSGEIIHLEAWTDVYVWTKK